MIHIRSFHKTKKNMVLGLFLVSMLAVYADATMVHSRRCVRWDSGQCAECYYGWYGRECEKTCTNCWNTGCYKDTGVCEQCEPGRYGRHCNTTCPDNCRPGRDGRVNCDRNGGGCQEECKEGWWGDTCDMRCCTNSKTGACYQSSGRCIGDCTRGWYGLSCDKRCSVGCFSITCEVLTGKCQDGCKPWYFGSRCDEECGANCKDGDCNLNGRCIKGCIEGFRGNTCHDICPINCLLCEQDTGTCTQCKMGWTGVSCAVRISETDQIPLISTPPDDTSTGIGCKTSSSNILLLLAALIVALSAKHPGFTVDPIFVNWRFQRPSISSVHPVKPVKECELI